MLPIAPHQISCVITSHLRAEFLGEAIESVITQQEPIGEIIVVSDVDDPVSQQLVENIGDSAPLTIRWVRSEPGLSRSRNRGIEASSLPWVALLDDDDLWASTFSLVVAEALSITGTPLALVAKRRFGTGGGPGTHAGDVIVAPQVSNASAIVLADSFAAGGNVVIQRDLARREPYDEMMFPQEDYDVLIRLLNQGVAYTSVDEPLVLSRLHADHISQNAPRTVIALRQLEAKHRSTLSWRARRRLRYRAAWVERTTANTGMAKARAFTSMAWNVPVSLALRRVKSVVPAALRP